MKRTRSSRRLNRLLCLIVVAALSVNAASFVMRTSSSIGLTRLFGNNPMAQQPGESSNAYMRRLAAAAADPNFGKTKPTQETTTAPSPTTTSTSNASTESDSSESESGRSSYVSIEEWDRREKEREKSLSWEERVQFDGLKHGNGVRQNDILQRHLKNGF